jgi:methionyl aminopeptidase
MSREIYLRVGNIHKEVCRKIKPLFKVGVSYLELVRKIEKIIMEYDVSLAFPVNIQPNNEVHYTPIPGDTRMINEGDVIKVDIGLHIEGYIADGAFTVSFNKDYDEMVLFTENLLKDAISGLKPGVKISEIGRRLDEGIKNSDYRLIKNLMGHQIDKWELHSRKSVMVYETDNDNVLEAGEAYAVEIFVTDGVGMIKSSPNALIYALKKKLSPVRDLKVRKMCQQIQEKRRCFPFGERYITEHLGYSKMDFFNLKKSGNLVEYPILLEVPNSKIAQFEDVIYVDEDKVIVTTK